MIGKSGKTLTDKELWQLYRAGVDRRGVAGEIDPGLIAAYLDRGLLPAEREAVEAWLAGTPDAVDVLLAARRTRLEGFRMPAPDAVLQAARKMPYRSHARDGTAGISARTRRVSWLIGAIEWSGVTAALLLACAVGFQLGVDSAKPTEAVEIAITDGSALELVTPIESLFESDRPDPFSNGGSS